MRRNVMIGVAVLAAMPMSVPLAMAGPWRGFRGSGGWRMGGGYQSMYNPATVESVSGTIERIDRVALVKRMSPGVHVTLATENGLVSVHLGPEWYVERLDAELAKGDSVEVRGSRVTYEEKPAIIAAEVRKGDDVLNLRDANGVPAWAGWRR